MLNTIDLTKSYSGRNKSKVLVIRMTPDETEFIKKQAHDSGSTISQFVRAALQKLIQNQG